MKNVILIGYRCTGKSTAGKKLAERLARPFFDTDNLIARQSGTTIVEIVKEGGWELFRKKEKDVIQSLSHEKNAVIAAGGGTFDDKENRDMMKKNGLFICLTGDVDTLVKRMSHDKKSPHLRPPLSDDDIYRETTRILNKRTPIYRQIADYTVDTSERTNDEVVDEIYSIVIKNKELSWQEIQ
jgi:shikimate kinase